MAQEALDELDNYERTSHSGEVFDKIKAVCIPCLDGENLSQSVKKDIPIRGQCHFQEAVFSLIRLNTLRGGVGKNPQARKNLKIIKQKALELSNNIRTSSGHITIFYSWQANLFNRTNRGLIEDCRGKAVREINKGLTIG